MNTATIKTTLIFSPAFHLRLKRRAEREGKAMAQIVEETLTPVLEAEERVRLQRLYNGLFELKGMVDRDIPNASSSIDEVVYGGVKEQHGE